VTAQPGVVFTYPAHAQLDVPLGARIVVTFSEPVVASALDAISIEGPDGPIAATPEITGDGYTVQLSSPHLAPGTTYGVVVGRELAPTATNLPEAGPLFSFTTRAARPRSAAPSLLAVNGAPPEEPTRFRPMLESSTIRLVFSEPLDPRTVSLGDGGIELLDAETLEPVPATLVSGGIHVSIDPHEDLVAGRAYELRLGSRIADLGGQTLAAQAIQLVPENSKGDGTTAQVLRTRQPGDPGPERSRAGVETNVVVIDKPLIGREETALLPSALAAEMGDPTALDGPIAFTLRRGQRLRMTGLDIALGGTIPAGLSTGEIVIELVTDGGGRLYRNPYHPIEQRPEDARAPLYVDLSLDVAVYAVDPSGNATLTQTVLGVQATGTATATDGVLAIENVACMELGLLGVTSAPSNMVLELITDPSAAPESDQTPPALVASFPAADANDHAVDAGIELIFDEPVDLDVLRAGALRLETAGGVLVPAAIESHGAAVVLRPVTSLAYSTSYRVVFDELRDLAGNALAAPPPLAFSTPTLPSTGVPLTVTAVYPGVACALSNGRCASGQGGDDTYHPFTVPANQAIEVTFSQSPTPSTISLGTACGAGSVRVEALDDSGACTGAVPGTLVRRDRRLSFVPDAPWTEGARYRLTLVSGGNEACNAGELCGPSGDAASFDPLAGTSTSDGGGPNLVIELTGAPPTQGTFLLKAAGPITDVNGSGHVENGEVRRDENRAAVRITGTSGIIGDAELNGPDCVPSTPEREGCMYLSGMAPVILGEVTTACPLPGGEIAASCIPVTVSPQPMYGTSLSMTANVLIDIDTDTGTNVMRLREPEGGPLTGYIIDDGGSPTFVLPLDVYLDAPDMSVPLASHDLRSKPLSLVLRGPVAFLPDGRIEISLANTEDVPFDVNISAAGLDGTVQMVVPARQMKLRLVTPPSRGGL